jgi:hypothetical protein
MSQPIEDPSCRKIRRRRRRRGMVVDIWIYRRRAFGLGTWGFSG